MTSTVRHVTRTVVTRRPSDIDPKVAGPAVIAGLVIAVAIALVVLLTVLGKPVDWAAIVSPAGIALLTVLVGYLRRSSHAELVDGDLQTGSAIATTLVHDLEPVIAVAAPSIAPEAAEIQSGVDAIAAALADTDPATAGAPAPAVMTLP